MAEPRLFKVQLDNGEAVVVAPLSPFVRRAIHRQAEAEYPDPDRTLYLKPLGAQALDPNLLPPDETSDELMAAKLEVERKRSDFFWRAVVDAGVVIDTPEGKAKTLKRYKDQLDRLRQYDGADDDWTACVKLCLVTTNHDVVKIANTAAELLLPGELTAAVELFRRDV